jgi:hypothetical protein
LRATMLETIAAVPGLVHTLLLIWQFLWFFFLDQFSGMQSKRISTVCCDIVFCFDFSKSNKYFCLCFRLQECFITCDHYAKWK